MNGSAQFYGFAALIIPVLLFGGAVSDRWRPKNAPAPIWAALTVIGAMLFAIAAEVIAIDAAFTGHTSSFGRAIVVLAVTGGTVAAAGAVTWPWKDRLGCLYNVIVTCTLLAAVVVSVTTFEGLRPTGTGSGPTPTDKAPLQLGHEERAEASRLDQLAGQDLVTRSTLRHAFDLMSAELAQTRAANAALIRAAEEH